MRKGLVRIRKLFVVGVFAAAPLALTIYLIITIAGWFDSLFQPVIQRVMAPYYLQPIPGLGMIVGFFLILLVGLIAPSLIGKQVLSAIEKFVDRLPLVKMVYSGTKQFFDSFSQSGVSKFSRVVLIKAPVGGATVMGFVTQELLPGTLDGTKGKQLAVFIPTTPNPTSGYLLFVPESETVTLKISAEEALKLIISVGIVKSSYAYLKKA